MKLYLEDNSVFEGESFGANVEMTGEVVFSTGMTGYVESLTDPSFAGQILVCTYPLIGNYGVPDSSAFESEKIQVAGLVVTEYSTEYSHADAVQSLASWLKKNNIPAITGVDTRAITKKLRERGVLLGALANEKPSDFIDPNRSNLVAKVSPKQVRTYGDGPVRIIAIDCGMKENIVRSLTRQNVTLTRVPWDYDFTKDQYDALFISNGPGDPEQCTPTIAHIKQAMKDGKPILGICLGNQLLALAAGGRTYKLKYGHRGQNQSCIDTATGRCYITSQNHGFAVDADSLPSSWHVWFTNANDGSVEGIRHKDRPWRSVQFHPEAAPGPTDTAWIFDKFIDELGDIRRLKTNHDA
ncbi:MAG: glutamine-hydrolyzing carbamoyl-phosphate synthase small subunit [Candidatus Pacebacteria bacterium]|nr:glutamine-hydrolyzing carbamoyl-phosphate synthase small subunit [Candidatus Paceibacterota bacterium]